MQVRDLKDPQEEFSVHLRFLTPDHTECEIQSCKAPNTASMQSRPRQELHVLQGLHFGRQQVLHP